MTDSGAIQQRMKVVQSNSEPWNYERQWRHLSAIDSRSLKQSLIFNT